MIKKCVTCEKELNGLKQKHCSNACKQKYHWHQVKEQQNTYHSQTMRSYKRKLILIDISGGGCEKCGYNKNIAALHFHHRDSNDKKFPLDSRHLSNKRWELILKEYEKCDLLCGNCHSEHHSPEMEINNVRLIVETIGH